MTELSFDLFTDPQITENFNRTPEQRSRWDSCFDTISGDFEHRKRQTNKLMFLDLVLEVEETVSARIRDMKLVNYQNDIVENQQLRDRIKDEVIIDLEILNKSIEDDVAFEGVA